MTRMSVTLALFCACLVAGCAGQLAAVPGIHAAVSPPSVEVPVNAPADDDPLSGPVYAPGEDRHWIQADDFFISEEPWTQGWIYVHLAKMRQAPEAATKGQARFFQLDDSREVWTGHFWRTRPADPGELALGQLVLCFNDNVHGDVYHRPPSKDRARTGAWFLGKITDVSDAFKHVVRVDVYNCAMDAVRVVGR